MSDRDLALLDLHLPGMPPPSAETVEALAEDGLVRIVENEQHARMRRHAELRARIEELDAERHGLRARFTWPWRRARRRERIDELGERIDEIREDAQQLRARLHADALAREHPELLIRIPDGRHATLTAEGVNHLHEWAYSDCFDRYIDPDAGAARAEWCMAAYRRIIDEWQVAYPPPTVGTAAALASTAGEDGRDACLERLIALFGEWRQRYRACPADRLMRAAVMALDCRQGEAPLEAEQRAREYQETLCEFGFHLGQETQWAGAMLSLHGATLDSAERVHEIWRGLIQTGWSMSPQTWVYATRLSLARGRPVDITSRLQRIFDRLAPRLLGTSAGKTAAASILAHSDLHPQPTRRTARLLEEQSSWDACGDRFLDIHRDLPQPRAEVPGGDTRPAIAAILAQMPGSNERVRDAFDRTLAALREEAGPDLPRAADTGVDPLTGAALLLMDRGWAGRAYNRVFAMEACACGRTEHWDQITIFRFSEAASPTWTHSGQ